MPDEIVVDIEVPFLVTVHHALLADLNFLDEPHQRRPVKLFQIVIILHLSLIHILYPVIFLPSQPPYNSAM